MYFAIFIIAICMTVLGLDFLSRYYRIKELSKKAETDKVFAEKGYEQKVVTTVLHDDVYGESTQVDVIWVKK